MIEPNEMSEGLVIMPDALGRTGDSPVLPAVIAVELGGQDHQVQHRFHRGPRTDHGMAAEIWRSRVRR